MDDRNYGLDLFRLASMLFITCLHLVAPYFHLMYCDTPRPQFLTGLFIEYACYCGVNCFAMLSGYLASETKSDYDGKWFSKAAFLWVQLFIWSVSIYYIGRWFMPDKTVQLSSPSAIYFPVANELWWYMTCYFGLLAFSPLLNKALSTFDAKKSLVLASVLFLTFSIIPTVAKNKYLFSLGNGYSVLWLVICYVFGAMLKKNGDKILRRKHAKLILALLAFLCVILPYFHHVFPYYYFPSDKNIYMFMSYLSPFCVIEAASLLLLFSSITIRSSFWRKVLSFLSANALGIYLFQNHQFVWQNFFMNDGHTTPSAASLAWLFPAMLIFLAALGIAINFFISGVCKYVGVKKFAEKLFQRLFRTGETAE